MRKLRGVKKTVIKSLGIKPPKTSPDPKTIQVLQQIATKLQLLVNQLNSQTEEKEKVYSEPELKINVRLTTQKRQTITKESVKTLNITWRDDKYYSDFIRYQLTDRKLTLVKENIMYSHITSIYIGNFKRYESEEKELNGLLDRED